MVNSNLRDRLSGIAQIGSLDAKSKLDVTCIESITELLKIEKTNDNIIEINPSPTYPHHAKLRTTYTAPTQESDVTETVTLNLSQGDGPIFECGDVIRVQGVSGYHTDGTLAYEELELYVVSRNGDQIEVSAINGKKIGNITNCVPSMSSGTTFIRQGRSGQKLAEDEMPIYEYYRVDSESKINYTQKFCVSLNESPEDHVLSGAIIPNSKMSDLERDTLKAYMLSRESSFLYGVGSENYYTTQGIWYQAGKTFNYDEDSLTQESVIDMMREAFTSYNNQNVDGKYKILIGGSGLISQLNKLNYTKVVYDKNITNWGICFGYIYSNFGTVKILCNTIFDNIGMSDNGIIIDPQYIKYMVKSPLSASYDEENEMLIISEESALVLSEPEAHMRIVMQ